MALEVPISPAEYTYTRSLVSYDLLLFAGLSREEASVVASLMHVSGDPLSVVNALQSQLGQNPTGSVTWADFGGGLGVAQAELHHRHDSENISSITIDKFPYCFDIKEHQGVIHPEAKEWLSEARVGNTPPRQQWIQACATSVILPRPAHLATAVWTVPYWDAPLEGIANMYNQLVPGGVMAIVTDSDYPWSAGIRDDGRNADSGQLMVRVARNLKKAGVEVATTQLEEVGIEECDVAFGGLYVRRADGRKLRVIASHVTSNYPEGEGINTLYKIARYTVGPNESPLELV